MREDLSSIGAVGGEAQDREVEGENPHQQHHPGRQFVGEEEKESVHLFEFCMALPNPDRG